MTSSTALFIICTLFFASNFVIGDSSIGAGTTADPAFYYSSSYYLGNGAFRTYVAIDHEQEVPVSIGCEFSRSYYINPPANDVTLQIPLPDMASVYTPFQSFETNWMPGGHPGTPWNRGHFDWHFYLQNKAYRDSEILPGTCSGGVSSETFCRGVAPVPAPCCPSMYVMPSAVVVSMGNHMASMFDTAFSGDFENSMIIGVYDGRPTFIEPMITIQHQLAVANGSLPTDCRPISQSTHMPVGGYYPTQYCFYGTPNNMRLELNSFVLKPGGCGTVEEDGISTCAYNGAAETSVTMNMVKNCNKCPHFKYTKDQAIDA